MTERAYATFLVAIILGGAGGSGVWTIGITYIDDNADPKKSSIYIGVLFAVRLMAPVAGLALGAGMARVPLHLVDNGLLPEDSDWVGAWWLGYFIIAVLSLLLSAPLLFYPAHLPAKVADGQEGAGIELFDEDFISVSAHGLVSQTDEEKSFMWLLKALPRVTWAIMCNPLFILVSLAQSIDVGISVGFSTFVPKFIEVYYHTTASTANVVTGVSLSFAVALGSLIGGYLTSRLSATLNRKVLATVVSSYLVLIVFSFIYIIDCPDVKMAGVNWPKADVNITALVCNKNCDCDNVSFQPVCASDGISYYSPCHAGCTKQTLDAFMKCACVEGDRPSATNGQCVVDCASPVVWYGIVLFIVSGMLSAMAMPLVMVILRCTNVEDKSMAVAIVNVMVSLAIFPSPIIYGLGLDTTCLLHSRTRCGIGDACAIYDNQSFRWVLHTMTLVGRLVPPSFSLAAWYYSRNMVFAGDTQQEDENKLISNKNGGPYGAGDETSTSES